MDSFINLLVAAVLAGTPLLFGTLGEILTEKSGNLNLGVEGLMFMGGVAGLAGAYYYERAAAQPSGLLALIIALVCAFVCGAFGSFIFSLLTITLRANQNVTGLALTIFGTGFANFFGEVMANQSASGYAAVGDTVKAAFAGIHIPVLSDIPYLGKLLFSYNVLVYLGIAAAIAMAWFLKHSRRGLNLRAVGESPQTADAAGIDVTRYKYAASCIGGGIWVHDCIGGKGWIAVALVIFAMWSPARALLGSLVFGALSIMRLYVSLGIPTQLYDTLPYVATVLVLVFVSFKHRRENQPPASLGNPYFREER